MRPGFAGGQVVKKLHQWLSEVVLALSGGRGWSTKSFE